MELHIGLIGRGAGEIDSVQPAHAGRQRPETQPMSHTLASGGSWSQGKMAKYFWPRLD